MIILIYTVSIFLSFLLQQSRFANTFEFLTTNKVTAAQFQIRSEPIKYLTRYASDQEQIQYSMNAKLIAVEVDNLWHQISAPISIRLAINDFSFYRGQVITAQVESIFPASGKRSCCVFNLKDDISLVSPAGWAYQFAHHARENLRLAMPAKLPMGGSLVPGLILGDTSTQAIELATAMRGSGLAHLTAVSGGNVAIVLGFFIAIANVFRLNRTSLIALSAIALAGYVLVVGFDASVLRAATMGSITLLAILTKRSATTGLILMMAVYLLTVFNPWLWLNWGFLLSVSATAGLIWFAPKLLPLIPWPTPFNLLALLLVSTFAASWITAPVLAVLTGEISIVTLLANLIAAPLVAITTVLGLVTVLFSLINPILGMPIAFMASIPAELIGQIAVQTSKLPGAQLRLNSFPSLILFFLILMTLFFFLLLHRKRQFLFLTLVTLIISYPFLLGIVRKIDGWPPANSFIIVCDVGQGAAVLLPLDRKSGVLIDSGPDPELVSQCLKDAGVSKVVALFISHFHADHTGGTLSIIKSNSVNQIYISPNQKPLATSEQILTQAKLKQIPINTLAAGDSIQIGEFQVKVLSPIIFQISGNENDDGLILLVSKGKRSFLFTGDLEPLGQEKLMQQQSPMAEVVLVPHHGSKYQAAGFATWSGAKFGVISVGKNNFGHPAAETIADWEKVAQLVSTADLGDIAIVDHGQQFQVIAR